MVTLAPRTLSRSPWRRDEGFGPEVLTFVQDWVPSEVATAIRELFEDVGRQLPKPNVDAHNALGWQRRHGGHGAQFHWSPMSSRRHGVKNSTRTRVSARTLLDLLSGAIDYETFVLRAGISTSRILSLNCSYAIGFAFRGCAHQGLRHLGQTRGSSGAPPLGIHSCAHRSHRYPSTVIGTKATRVSHFIRIW